MSFDLLGLGCVALDELLYIPSFPAPDAKVRVIHSEQRCGGLTGVALLAAARLGARCAYAGRLGFDPLSEQASLALSTGGVDTSHAPRAQQHGIVRSTIVVAKDTGTRNVFSQATGLTGAHDTLPDSAVIQSAKVIVIDHHGTTGALRAARLARESGIPIVADLERDDPPHFAELLDIIDHLVLSEGFARRITSAASAHEAAERLWHPRRAAVVVTAGEQGCWYRTAESDGALHCAAMQVEAVDTTSCGDVFHGAYAAALAFGWTLEKRLSFATTAAALKASRAGGLAALPTREEVEAHSQLSLPGRNPNEP